MPGRWAAQVLKRALVQEAPASQEPRQSVACPSSANMEPGRQPGRHATTCLDWSPPRPCLQGGAALYLVARPKPLADLYRNCLKQLFNAFCTHLRELGVTQRGPDGQPTLYRMVLDGSFTVATYFNG